MILFTRMDYQNIHQISCIFCLVTRLTIERSFLCFLVSILLSEQYLPVWLLMKQSNNKLFV